MDNCVYTTKRSYDFKERFMFKMESVLDKMNNTFVNGCPLYPLSTNAYTFNNLRQVVDHLSFIDWKTVY